jgi:hypothetical protein
MVHENSGQCKAAQESAGRRRKEQYSAGKLMAVKYMPIIGSAIQLKTMPTAPDSARECRTMQDSVVQSRTV